MPQEQIKPRLLTLFMKKHCKTLTDTGLSACCLEIISIDCSPIQFSATWKVLHRRAIAILPPTFPGTRLKAPEAFMHSYAGKELNPQGLKVLPCETHSVFGDLIFPNNKNLVTLCITLENTRSGLYIWGCTNQMTCFSKKTAVTQTQLV